MPFNLDEQFVLKTEEQLGMRLPESYRLSMIAANGGEVELDKNDFWQLYPIYDNSDKKRLKRTCNHILRQSKSMREYGFPENGLAIGENGCGDVLLFFMEKGKVSPQVYIWWHETGEVSEVARDFSKIS